MHAEPSAVFRNFQYSARSDRHRRFPPVTVCKRNFSNIFTDFFFGFSQVCPPDNVVETPAESARLAVGIPQQCNFAFSTRVRRVRAEEKRVEKKNKKSLGVQTNGRAAGHLCRSLRCVGFRTFGFRAGLHTGGRSITTEGRRKGLVTVGARGEWAADERAQCRGLFMIYGNVRVATYSPAGRGTC